MADDLRWRVEDLNDELSFERNRLLQSEANLIALARMYGEACWKMVSALACVDDLAAENSRLQSENDHLRASLANSGGPCTYCRLPKKDWAKCSAGFPGCARADDAGLCPHVGSWLYKQGELTAAEERFGRLLIAFHDATRRPLGITPDSGLEFYDPLMADEAEARRSGRPVLRDLPADEAAARAAALEQAWRDEGGW